MTDQPSLAMRLSKLNRWWGQVAMTTPLPPAISQQLNLENAHKNKTQIIRLITP
jgi:hypothetical protein